MHVSIACVMAVLLQPACTSGGTPGKPASAISSTKGELKLIFGQQPDDTILVHGDGAFELVSRQQTSLRGCGGICPRRLEQFAVRGNKITQGSRELLTRAADGTVDTPGLGQLIIDDDGVLIQSGQRRALDARGRLPPLDSEPAVTIVGATTPALRRRAMLVLVFVVTASTAAAIDRASH